MSHEQLHAHRRAVTALPGTPPQLDKEQPMSLTTLFARRPAPAATAPSAAPAACETKPPRSGENWQPEGVTIAERYYNQAHAVVLVYTTAARKTGTYYTVACLGCHYASAQDGQRTYNLPYSLADAAKVANEHATTCRALPRDIPDRPDDDTIRERLHAWVRGARRPGEDVELWIFDLELVRLALQRTNDWIAAELRQLAVDQPETLRTERSQYSDSVFYYARQLPKS
ncbi:hypothetical protein [Streptomyces sp. NPDC006925]|uniref:hypothetical protein n=1 Tax=Streptomyces sp. NPDC006925 TaxID=3364768 RepID=UPI00368FBDD8